MQTNRLYFIDAVRAFAILMMLQGHFIDTLILPIYKNNTNNIYTIWSYFRGITAPLFFTISGLIFTFLLFSAYTKGYDKLRIKKGILRGSLLLIVGYSLRINFNNGFTGFFSSRLLIVDVLQCIGISLLLLIFLHALLKKRSHLLSLVLFLIGFICFITEPLYRSLNLETVPIFLANYFVKTNGSIFTLFPWFGYSAFGGFLAILIYRNQYKIYFKNYLILAFLTSGSLLIFYSTWVLLKLYDITNIELLKNAANYNYLFTRLGDVLIIIGLFYALERFLKRSVLTKIGEKTLSIYVIHFILLYGSYTGFGLKRLFNKSLEPIEAALGAIIFIIVVCLIAFNYAKTNAFVYTLIRKLINLFKQKKTNIAS